MSLRIFHTSDLHIGLKFTRGYSDDIVQKLSEARLSVVSRLVELANREQCNLFVVAGDLFDNLRVPKSTIRRVAESLRRFEGVVAVLPGNHDYIQKADDPVWPVFRDALGEGHLLLTESVPYDLSSFDLPGVLFPGACRSRHSQTNAVGWIQSAVDGTAATAVKIGVAHGSLEGLSPDFNGDYFPMTRRELAETGLDLWLLGHTHLRYPDKDQGDKDTVFYSSVPEPDGFDCRHGGYAWIIDAEPGGTIACQSVRTGQFQFQDLRLNVNSKADIAALKERFSLMDHNRDLVKLKLIGRLAGALIDDLPALAAELQKHVLHLELDTTEIVRFIAQQDIDRDFTEGSFPHLLLSRLSKGDADPLALQIAYEIVQGARR